MKALDQQDDPNEWCLFIDSSKMCLKAALFYNVNEYPSLPIAHVIHMEGLYDNVIPFLMKHIMILVNIVGTSVETSERSYFSLVTARLYEILWFPL
jgi:hypothetical protein